MFFVTMLFFWSLSVYLTAGLLSLKHFQRSRPFTKNKHFTTDLSEGLRHKSFDWLVIVTWRLDPGAGRRRSGRDQEWARQVTSDWLLPCILHPCGVCGGRRVHDGCKRGR